MTTSPTGSTAEPALRDKVERILDLIRPSIQGDGGDIELIDVAVDGVVRIRLQGACVGCPSSQMTLREGIEENLRRHVPQVTEVVAID